jgi:hypothetical protein
MRSYEKVWTLTLVTGMIAVAAMLASAVSGLANPSMIPNNNTKLCYNPTDGVANCGDLTSKGQTSCQSSKHYAIENFPDGSISGGQNSATKQEQADCWRWAYCVWNTQTNKCVAPQDGDYSVLYAAAKTVANPAGEG